MAGRGAIPVQLSPDFIAAIRHDYVDTDKPMRQICNEYGISLGKLNRTIIRENWPRRTDRPPRDLPPALRLREQARRLVACVTSPRLRGEVDPPERSEGGSGEGQFAAARDDGNPPSPGSHCADAQCEPPSPRTRGEGQDPVARLEALVLHEIAAEEAVRTQLGGAPRARGEADKIAHTLKVLTQTLQDLRRLRAGAVDALPNQSGPTDDDDDMPADLDEFRYELARRINAFVESRTGGGDAAQPADAAPVEAT